MKPLLVKSDLSGEYYIVTRYRIDGKSIVAVTKYGVTDQVKALFPRYFKKRSAAIKQESKGGDKIKGGG